LNSYPKYLDIQLQNVYSGIIRSIDKELRPQIIKEYKSDITVQTDSIEDVINNFAASVERAILSDDRLAKRFEQIYTLVNSWTYRETEKAIQKVKSVQKGFSVGFQPDVGAPLFKDAIAAFRRFNVSLAVELGRGHIFGIGLLAENAFREGIPTKDLTAQYRAFSGVSQRKGRFWAVDQMGNAYSSLTEQRQTFAGFDGYIWRTSKDGSVRPEHAALEGKFFKWSQGAYFSKRGRYLHPGQDYRCRCTAEAAFSFNQ